MKVVFLFLVIAFPTLVYSQYDEFKVRRGTANHLDIIVSPGFKSITLSGGHPTIARKGFGDFVIKLKSGDKLRFKSKQGDQVSLIGGSYFLHHISFVMFEALFIKLRNGKIDYMYYCVFGDIDFSKKKAKKFKDYLESRVYISLDATPN